SAYSAASLRASMPSPRGATVAIPELMGSPSLPPPPKARAMLGTIQLGDLQQGHTSREAIIGRTEPAEIVLPYPQVSVRRASIAVAADGMIVITDLGSTNGTFVEHGRIPSGHPVRIRPGDRIFIGPYSMIVTVEGGALRAYVERVRAEWSGNQVEIEAL